jgi:hypothetical protein
MRVGEGKRIETLFMVLRWGVIHGGKIFGNVGASPPWIMTRKEHGMSGKKFSGMKMSSKTEFRIAETVTNSGADGMKQSGFRRRESNSFRILSMSGEGGGSISRNFTEQFEIISGQAAEIVS